MLRTVGWVQRVIVNRVTGHIVDGHLRVEVALRRSEPTVPVLYVELSDEEEKVVLAAIDPIGGLAETDQDMLDDLLEGVHTGDTDLDAFLDSLRSGGEVDEVEEGLIDDDDVPDIAVQTVSKPGDVWLLGRHRLMCGDSTNIQHVEKLMAGGKADLVWTDPPYNVAIDGKAGTIMNDDMGDSQFRDFLLAVYGCYFAVMREGACIYVAHADSERANFTQAYKDSGLKLSQVLIWVKQSATLSRQDFNWQHEPILYGWKEGAGHYFCGDFTRTTVIDDDVDLKNMKREQLIALVNDMRTEAKSTVLRHDRPTKSDLHPTMKPVALVQRMIQWSSRNGEVVLDLFGGSGSTLIAAHKCGRQARLMELDPRFADVIVRRWQEFSGESATLEADGRAFDDIPATTQAGSEETAEA
jgi:DNA modification methylase